MGNPRVRLAAAGLAIVCVIAMSTKLMDISKTEIPRETAGKTILEEV